VRGGGGGWGKGEKQGGIGKEGGVEEEGGRERRRRKGERLGRR